MCDLISRPPAEEQTVFQSGFRAPHNTGTALVKVTYDLLTAADSGLVSMLAACDTYSVSFQRLGHVTGIEGSFLGCFTLHLCVKFPSYAVDTQLYLSTNPEET